MARIRGFSSTPRRGPRRKTAWELSVATGVDGAAQSITASGATLGTTSIAIGLDGGTLVRTRGELSLFLTQASSLGDGYTGAFGIGIATSTAILAGAASLPTPLTEETDENWIYHRYFTCFAGGIIGASAAGNEQLVDPTSAALRVEVDSKAMRKEAIGLGYYCCLEVVEVGTAGLRWAFNSRMLVKLP